MNWEMEIIERELLGQPVRGLQYMLRQISRRYPFIPQLTADGIFGERTLEAVMQFQKHMHPPVTGVVDRETFQAIRDLWRQVERELAIPRQLRGYPRGERTAAGESRASLYLVQSMFQSLRGELEGIEPGPIDGVHSERSVENTRWLQARSGLPETGEMNARTWEMLTRLYELFVVRRCESGGELGLVQGRG